MSYQNQLFASTQSANMGLLMYAAALHVLRMWRSAVVLALVALGSTTARGQTCNTTAGGYLYVDACCFKEQPGGLYVSCEGVDQDVTLRAEFLGALPNGFLEDNVVTWQWERQSPSGSWYPVGAMYETGGGGSMVAEYVAQLGQPALAGNYRCKFEEFYNPDRPTFLPCGVVYSATSTIVVTSVPTQPRIQAVSQTICPGTYFTLNASGPVPDSNNLYQWYKDGVAITGGNYSGFTTNRLTMNLVNQGHAAEYYCVLERTGSCPVVRTSNIVDIGVHPAGPTIDSVPFVISKTTCPGTPMTLGPVVATGENFTYQWYKVLSPTFNLRLSDGYPLGSQTQFSGTNTGTITIENAGVDASGSYFCTVEGVCRTLSGVYTCEVTIIPGVSFSPSSYGIDPVTPSGAYCEAFPVATGVFIRADATTPNSSDPIYYRWYKRRTGDIFDRIYDGPQPGSAAIIAGANTNQIQLTNYRASASGDYRCTASTDPNFSAACGTVSGRVQTLTVVNTTSSIVSGPSDVQQCLGTDVTFVVSATNSPQYTWYGPTSTGGYVRLNNGVQAGTNTVVSGATTNTLRLSGITAADLGRYKCEVLNSCGFSAGGLATANLSTFDAPTIISQSPATMSGCIGSTVFLSVEATGSELTYQWTRNNVDLTESSTYSNVNSPTLQVAIGANFNTANFRCRITSTCSSVTSNAISLSRSSPVIISTQPVAVSGCAGIGATFSVAISQGTNPTYQWRKNGVALVDGDSISGSTSTTLSLVGTDLTSAGNYRCDITNSCGVISTNTVALNIESPQVITPPMAQSLCVGGTFSLTVTAAGSNLNFVWRNGALNVITPGTKANGTVVTITSTATTSTLTMTNAQDADVANFYHARISNTCGAVSSASAAITFNPATEITTHPLPVTVCANASTSLSVVASGGPVGFQWQKDNVNITDGGVYSGATTSVLNISSGQAGDSGMYRCLVTSLCGTSTIASNAALVTIKPRVVISSQPAAQPVCLGGTATFTVAATGGTLTYQWQKGTVNIAGATSATLTLTSITADSVAYYRCRVTNDCNTVTSDSAPLTINTTAITNQPDAFAGCTQGTGGTATFTITASGETLSYQWRKGTTNLSDGGRISGATSRILTISGLVAADAANNYNCVVATPCTSVTSSNAALTLSSTPPVITTHPVSQTECSSSFVVFSVAASGSNLTYQWKKDGVNISGATSSSFFISSLQANAHQGAYHCVVSNGCGSVVSNSATLEVYTQLSIATQPVSQARCAGTFVFLEADFSGSPPASQWQRLTAPNTWTNVDGANALRLEFLSIAAGDAGSYRCVLTNGCSSAITQTAVLTVNTPPMITSPPVAQAVCQSGTTTFSVAATGSGLTYRWQKNNANLTDGAVYSGVLTPTLTITGVTAADVGNYRCRFTGTCEPSPIFTTNVALTLATTPPEIISQPQNAAICEGADAHFSVVVTGFETFLWKKNGVDLVDGPGVAGAATANLTLAAIDAADLANYSCDINNACGTTTSDAAALTISGSGAPIITTQPLAAEVCDPASAMFTIEATSDEPATYRWQWLLDGAAAWEDLVEGDNSALEVQRLNAVGADTASVTVTPLAGGLSNSTLRCIVSNSCGDVESDAAGFIVNFCCVGDYNVDGGIDGLDVGAFFLDWEAGNLAADVNHDGGVDGSDVDEFFRRWEAGC